MAKKWIVNEGRLKMANVEFHKDIANDHATTQGGGFWQMDNKEEKLYLWGVSSDFGYTEPEVLKAAIENTAMSPAIYGYTVMKSPIISIAFPHLESFEKVCVVGPQVKPDEKRPFIGINHGNDGIDLTKYAKDGMMQVRPTEIHLKENGALDDQPSFAIVCATPMHGFTVVGQITLRMFNEGLADIGYELVKKP